MSLVERVLMKVLPFFEIKKVVDGEDSVYLRRFFIFRSMKFNVYLHHILRSDDDADPHDHPWSFVTLMLKGRYVNMKYAGEIEVLDDPTGTTQWREFEEAQACSAPSIHTRAAEHCHQLKLKDGETCWTLVFTGPVRRHWQFITKDGPVYWREYLNDWSDRGHA